MKDANFLRCLGPVREHEGGNDDDPLDPGGRTSRGVTQREYDSYCSLHGVPKGDVWRAPEIIITSIYHDQYWLPWCPRMVAGLDYLFFDCSVLHGPARITKWTQSALGVDADGHIGVVTKAALEAANTEALIRRITLMRMYAIRRFKGFNRFGRGWIKRAHEVEALALSMMKDAPNA